MTASSEDEGFASAIERLIIDDREISAQPRGGSLRTDAQRQGAVPRCPHHGRLNLMTNPTKTPAGKTASITGADWDVSFWFAVLSPVLGILVGFLALLWFYH